VVFDGADGFFEVNLELTHAGEPQGQFIGSTDRGFLDPRPQYYMRALLSHCQQS
jgi:hypothetical protein